MVVDNIPLKARLYISLSIIFIIVFLSFSIVFYGFYQVYFAPATLFRHVFVSGGDVEEYFEDRIVNVAILGLHNRNEDNTFGEIYFVDTILIASVNFDQDSVTLLAIPRDSYVEIAHTGTMDRIRQAYSYGYESESSNRHQGGLDYTMETLNILLGGVKLHYYIAMDIEGLKQLIDSLGGVYYHVEKPLIGFTPQESLQEGPQILDGRGYVTYLTYREDDARDDLNRIQRQKALLLSTFDYFQEMGLFSYVIPAYSTYLEHIHTDLSFNQVTALTLFAGDRLESDAILDYSLEGEYFSPDNGDTYYLRLDKKLLENLLTNIF